MDAFPVMGTPNDHPKLNLSHVYGEINGEKLPKLAETLETPKS